MSTRKRPAPAGRPSRSNTNTPDSTTHRPEDGYAAPDAQDRREAQLLAEAEQLGYRLAARCKKCGSWIVARKSVEACMGPVCRRREAVGHD